MGGNARWPGFVPARHVSCSRSVEQLREQVDAVGNDTIHALDQQIVHGHRVVDGPAYTESTNGLGSDYPEDELNAMLNLMRKDIISEDIQEAKDEDADIIIASMHWGIEYDDEPNETQIDFAQFMAEEGVDIILGSHPHVIQKSELIETDDQQTFVIYSMGNFISNQRQETLDDERTEDGIIVNIDIQKNDETGETNIKNIDYIPTWVYRNKEDGDTKYTYRILPIENFLDATDISKSFIERMEHSLETTISKMADIPFEAQ